MRISDWSSDVCSSDLLQRVAAAPSLGESLPLRRQSVEEAEEPGPVALPTGGGGRRGLLVAAKILVSAGLLAAVAAAGDPASLAALLVRLDRKSTRLNSSH